MLNQAVETDCIFCVGTLTRGEVPDYASCTAEVGTAGLIRASREHEDGHSNLLLHGLCRVRFTEWLPGKSYPYARILPISSEPLEEDQGASEAGRLRDAVEAFLLGLPDDLVSQVRELINRAPDPAIMSDAIAQKFVEDPALRQSLLEELDVSNRIDRVIEHLRILRSGDN